MKTKILTVLTLIMAFSMIASAALAAPAPPASQASGPAPDAAAAPLIQAANAAGPARYFVILDEPAVPNYTGGISGFRATNPAVNGMPKLDVDSPAVKAYASHLEARQAALIADINQTLGRAPVVDSQLQYALNAVIMVLDPAEAATVAKLPGVAQVERETIEQVDTDYGPTWIGANTIWNGANTGGLPGTKGEGVIVGILDTGINMDHPSFAATGDDGYTHTNPFGAGVYKGLCASNPGTWHCNAKLVGYWIYTGETADDEDGHGSHTASTSAGNHLNAGKVVLGSYGYSPAISGVAPHANIIGYDVCTPSGCNSGAMVSAMNQAILDGVDVINVSISISGNTWTGAQQQGYFSLFNAGIVSARSAGNSGPGANTIGSTPPWVITVGANTHNRAGNNALTNISGGSTTLATLNGKGFSNSSVVAPIVYAGNAPYNDPLCQTATPDAAFAGKIVLCDRGTNARVAKGYNVLQRGAVGMVLANDSASGTSLNGDVHWLPAVQISYADGVAFKSWLGSGSGHQGKIAGTTISTAPANGDIMASFSSRGPHTVLTLMTPDVTNPGVDILAAYRSGATGPETPTVEYAVVSGTSMSSPHTAGSAALLVALHPAWTPAEIKSAMMGTGKFQGVLKEDGATPAIPFDMGAGRVDLSNAGNASLIMNETAANFTAANPSSGGDPMTLNLPSMINPSCAGACSWTRTLKATRAGTWNASYVTPTGLTLAATPSNFTLSAGQTQALNITANVTGAPLSQYIFGYVVLTKSGSSDPGDVIHLTVGARPVSGQATINVTPASLAATQAPNNTTSQNLTIGNTGTASLTWSIAEEPGSGGACSTPSSVPWLGFAPASGTTTGGGSASVTVTFDSTSMAPGAYNATLCVTSNDPATPLVAIPVTMTVTGTTAPNINVGPSSLTSTQAQNTSTTQTLNVGNTGTADLTWSIDEEDTTSLPAIVRGPFVAQPAAENVGTAAPAAPAAPTASTAPATVWKAPAAVLYDNGPLVTHPGGGAGGADASALQTGLGLSTYGFGHAVSGAFRVADDFTVPAGGWTIDSITFFAYQTGSSTTSTMTSINLRIWDGPPGQGGSTVVFGDTTTNRMTGSSWANMYRVLDTGLLDSTRPIMASTAAVNTFLPAGTYWVDWQTGGTLSSGPWAPPVSILGQTGKSGANAVQFDGSVWGPLEDTGALVVQDLPFVIEGPQDCDSPSSVSWLSFAPDSGTTAAGSSTPVTVTFNSTGLAVGTYTANLCVTSDDPDAGPGNGTDLVVVPVTLTVEEQTTFTLYLPAVFKP